LVLEKAPFFLIALAAGFAESRARELATLQEVGPGARLGMAVTAPFLYLWRTFVPLRLSPLDPLPIDPRVEWIPLLLGVVGLASVSLLVWRARTKWPAVAVAWVVYVLLLGPALGLTPSGQQATADRYTYIPSVALSLLIGGVAASGRTSQRRVAAAVIIVAVAVEAALMRATWRQATYWHDSITLWTRAVELDERNDIATYNLAIALVDAGRENEAAARFEQTLRLVPDHDLARDNLARIREKRSAKDVGDVNARAFALVQGGRHREAVDVLTQALKRHPDDDELAHNLARLLATTPDASVRDGALALRLALAVRDRTGGRDPRVLDTLAAAYAAQGQFDLSRETSAEAARLARAAGDVEMARAIEAQALLYQRLPAGGRR
jgi:tetratricopeptide (TPR) repeat protein